MTTLILCAVLALILGAVVGVLFERNRIRRGLKLDTTSFDDVTNSGMEIQRAHEFRSAMRKLLGFKDKI